MSSFLDGERLEPGLRYQDFITDELYDRGYPINCYSSQKWNIEKGESKAHLEIKFDDKMKSTGNLYIETNERHNITTQYGDSGIFREDNTTFYLIGDYNEAYVFLKKQLKAIIERNNFKKVENGMKTSIGVLVPISYLEKHPLLYEHLEFNKK